MQKLTVEDSDKLRHCLKTLAKIIHDQKIAIHWVDDTYITSEDILEIRSKFMVPDRQTVFD